MATTVTLSSYQLTAGIPVTLTITFDWAVGFWGDGAISSTNGTVSTPQSISTGNGTIWTAIFTPAAGGNNGPHTISVDLSKAHFLTGTKVSGTIKTESFTVAPAPSTPTLIIDGLAAPKVTDGQMVLSYNTVAGLDDVALTDNAGFTVTSISPGSTPITVSRVSVNAANNTVTLYLSRPVANLEQVRVSYTKPDNGNGVQDKVGHAVANFTDQAVTNNTPDTTPPVLITSGTFAPTVNGHEVIFSYTEANSLNPAAFLGDGGFTVTSVTGTTTIIPVDRASVNATNKTVTLTLIRPVANGEQVSVSKKVRNTPLSLSNVVRDAAGNKAAEFTGQSVINTADTTPPKLITSATAPQVNGDRMVLSYTDVNILNDAALTGSAGFTVSSPGSTPISVSSASVDAANKTVTLNLSRPVANGEQVRVSYTKPTGSNVVKDIVGNAADNFTGQAVNNATPDDTTAPALITDASAPPRIADGGKLVLSYTDANYLKNVPVPETAFAVTVNGRPNPVTGVAVDPQAKTVTLTLSSPVPSGAEVTITYTPPGDSTKAIQDTQGNRAVNFAGQVVDSGRDQTAPELIASGAAAPKVNGTQLVLSYSEANSLDPAALTGNAGFTVTSASPGRTPITNSSAIVHAPNKTAPRPLSRAVAKGEQVRGGYTKPSSGNVVQDAAGNDAANFTDQTVNTETPDTTPPVLITTGTAAPKVNGRELVLSYTEANSLAPAALAGNAGFTVTSASPGSTPITVTSASVDAANKSITLTLSRAVENLEQVRVSYTKPTTGNVVQDTAGNDAANFAGQAVNNETP